MKSPASGPLGCPWAVLKAAIELNGLAWVPLPLAGDGVVDEPDRGADGDRHRRGGRGEVVAAAHRAVEAGVAQRVGEGVDALEADRRDIGEGAIGVERHAAALGGRDRAGVRDHGAGVERETLGAERLRVVGEHARRGGERHVAGRRVAASSKAIGETLMLSRLPGWSTSVMPLSVSVNVTPVALVFVELLVMVTVVVTISPTPGPPGSIWPSLSTSLVRTVVCVAVKVSLAMWRSLSVLLASASSY